MNKPIIFEFWTQGRSGNHAIINWLVQNLVEDFDSRKLLLSNIGDHDSYFTSELVFINNFYERPKTFSNSSVYLTTALRKNPKYLIISYENKPMTHSIGVESDYKYTITRSLENLIASRLQYNKGNISPLMHMNVDEIFFTNWSKYVEHTPNIHFDKWIQDRGYRDDICKQLGIVNKDITDYVDKAGGGSSFIGHKLDTHQNLLTRYKQIELSREIKDRVEQLCKKYPDYCSSSN
jgi:hypothetical protein